MSSPDLLQCGKNRKQFCSAYSQPKLRPKFNERYEATREIDRLGFEEIFFKDIYESNKCQVTALG
jgi:hypothetical protein